MRASFPHHTPNHVFGIRRRRATRSSARLLPVVAFCPLFLLVVALYGRPPAVMAGPSRVDASPSRADAAIVSHSVSLHRDHGYLLVSGEARNVTRRDLPQLEAVVELLDESGRLISVESGLVKLGTIAAGDEAPFSVQAPDDRSIASYRLRFRKLAGALVPSRVED
jgi:hypothetical protein